LSNYVLGIRREYINEENKFIWIVDPVWDVVEGLGLTKADGRMPLPGGGWIEARWWISNGIRKCEASVNGDMSVHTREPCRQVEQV
jgi:hypothetical protein